MSPHTPSPQTPSPQTQALHVQRPFAVKLINSLGRIGQRFGMVLPSLNEQKLLDAARKSTGLHDFGDDHFRGGLQRLIESLQDDARMNQMGRILAWKQMGDLLCNRLKMIEYRKQHPEVAEEQVNHPLFVLGLPRTGTTIMYNLLAQDPACRSPLSWEVAELCPPPEKASYLTDPRIAKTEKQLDMLRKLIPGFDAIHPVGAQLPQECISILAYDFYSVQFELNFDIAGYQRWYNAQDLSPSYGFHKQVLQHLQSRYRGDYWVLKTPAHLGAIDAILAVYPDARIVQTHRDPLKVLPSVSSLYYALRSLCSDDIDPQRLGMQMVEDWSLCLQKGMDARDRLTRHKDQFYDVYFEDLLNEPFACIDRIYQHFGMTLTAEAEKCMRDFLNNNQRDKHGSHHYTLEMFGLDQHRDVIRQKFEPYCERFSIKS